jgi:hypothetical protein
MVWIELIELRIGTSGGLLWIWYWTLGFHEILGSSWMAAQLMTPREGLSSVCCWYVISGVGFPLHRYYDIVYCTSPFDFKSAAIPYQHWCLLAPSTRDQWYLFISPICLRQWYISSPICWRNWMLFLDWKWQVNFAQRPPWGLRFFNVQWTRVTRVMRWERYP